MYVEICNSIEQSHMTRSMIAFGSNHQRMKTQVIIRVSKLKEGGMNPQKEVDTMKVPLIELQMC